MTVWTGHHFRIVGELESLVADATSSPLIHTGGAEGSRCHLRQVLITTDTPVASGTAPSAPGQRLLNQSVPDLERRDDDADDHADNGGSPDQPNEDHRGEVLPIRPGPCRSTVMTMTDDSLPAIEVPTPHVPVDEAEAARYLQQFDQMPAGWWDSLSNVERDAVILQHDLSQRILGAEKFRREHTPPGGFTRRD